jgi:hypothetical protein
VGWKKLLLWGGLGTIAVLALIQAIPYGRSHTNPPVVAEPNWDSPRTRELAVRACFDCHSNQTVWPWYTNIAPVSWLAQSDVSSGRSTLNFSEWNRPQESAGDAAAVARDGSMPPWQYKIIHPKARLSSAETAELAQGLERTLGSSPGGGG